MSHNLAIFGKKRICKNGKTKPIKHNLDTYESDESEEERPFTVLRHGPCDCEDCRKKNNCTKDCKKSKCNDPSTH